MLARHFSHFFGAYGPRLHFAAHSHHPWPDVTRAAHERYWLDGAERADKKWEKVFGEVIPATQQHIAGHLALSDHGQVAFAPNTHEFVVRLFSCLDFSKPVRVLASAHEFHSFRRQALRLAETGRVELVEVPAEPYATFTDRYLEAATTGRWDMLWVSQVFFDSGFVVTDLDRLVREAPAQPLMVVDGYHAFCALPVDLAAIHRRAFYMAGGYKYAMSGEGACFLAIPPGNEMRPVDTGWYASFESLAGPRPARVPYSDGAFRFLGATFDPSGIYRMRAVMDWLRETGTEVGAIHRHSRALQEMFLAGAGAFAKHLVPPAGTPRGNFLTFDVDDAESLHARILEAGVYVDRRGRRIRFGFGVYHDAGDVDEALRRLRGVLP